MTYVFFHSLARTGVDLAGRGMRYCRIVTIVGGLYTATTWDTKRTLRCRISSHSNIHLGARDDRRDHFRI
jgi:hypothetical protein